MTTDGTVRHMKLARSLIEATQTGKLLQRLGASSEEAAASASGQIS